LQCSAVELAFEKLASTLVYPLDHYEKNIVSFREGCFPRFALLTGAILLGDTRVFFSFLWLSFFFVPKFVLSQRWIFLKKKDPFCFLKDRHSGG
jgi:hypothetical protein